MEFRSSKDGIQDFQEWNFKVPSMELKSLSMELTISKNGIQDFQEWNLKVPRMAFRSSKDGILLIHF